MMVQSFYNNLFALCIAAMGANVGDGTGPGDAEAGCQAGRGDGPAPG